MTDFNDPYWYEKLEFPLSGRKLPESIERACINELERLGYTESQVEVGLYKAKIYRQDETTGTLTFDCLRRWADLGITITATREKVTKTKMVSHTTFSMWSATDIAQWAAQTYAGIYGN